LFKGVIHNSCHFHSASSITGCQCGLAALPVQTMDYVSVGRQCISAIISDIVSFKQLIPHKNLLKEIINFHIETCGSGKCSGY
jgi:hypothetical protein